MALGWDAARPADRQRLLRYLSALVSTRRAPVHVNVAFNAMYFGYDLIDDAYVGGLDLFAFPRVRFGETTDALPVGAMVNIAAGEQPLFAEVVYKEGAHPALLPDGLVPGWLSGAPAGASSPDNNLPSSGPVLTERLVIDVDAFGQGFSATRERLDRLRRRRWLDADGHLLLNARYASHRDADLDETAYYAQYLLTRGRDQLLSAAAPLPLSTMLSDDAGDKQLAAALTGMLGAVADALAQIPELRMWRGYAFTRASLGARLSNPGPLGGDDLASLATGLARTAVQERRGRWAPAHTVTYTAVGPRLRAVRDAGPQLVDVGYAVAVCHANAVISDYARREVDENTGLLPDDIHLRLDDPWQGGGVWRAEHPGSAYARIDATNPLGLGWSSTLPTVPPDLWSAKAGGGDDVSMPPPRPEHDLQPEPEPAALPPDPDDDGGFGDLTVADSQISWTQSLRLVHLLEGRLPLPDVIGVQMRDAGLAGVRLRLMLTHDGHNLEPSEASQTVESHLFGRPQLTDVDWPLEFFASIVLTCTWPRGASVVRAATTLLESPVVIDDMEITHRYDPRILTRDAAPGEPQRGSAGSRTGTMSLAQRVLRAVRRLGLLDPNGRAVLARGQLPAVVYGAADSAAPGELNLAVKELLESGQLRDDVGSVDAHQRLCYPAEPGQPSVPLVVYEPHAVEGLPRTVPNRTRSVLEARFVRTHTVAGHLRRLRDVYSEASDEARQAYREDRARFWLSGPSELPKGYTYVRPFTRGSA